MADTYRVSIDYNTAEVDRLVAVSAVEKLVMLNAAAVVVVVVGNCRYFRAVAENYSTLIELIPVESRKK